MRLQSSHLLEITPSQDVLDFLQLKTQLSVEQDLLQLEQLLLFVTPKAVRPTASGLEQARFIVEMKRAHADSRHCSHLLDCVSHCRPPTFIASPRQTSPSTAVT